MSHSYLQKETVIPTAALPDRREGEAQSRDLLFSLISRRSLISVLPLLALAPICALAQTAAVTADLPPGPMQAKATTTCMECHEARIILQQRLSKATWAKEVDKMTKWGAVVDPADRDALIDYLSANFSPDKPPYEPPRTTGKNGKTNK